MYNELIDRINKVLRDKDLVIIAICGYGGSGKSFLADKIAKEFNISSNQILHMDYLHSSPKEKIKERNIFSDHDWNLIFRILKEAKKGKRLKYKTMGLWGHSNEFDEPMPRVLIIEGVRLLRREITPFVDISVWIDAPVKFVTERAKKRDRDAGQDESHIKIWDEVWVPKNDRYVSEINPKELADFIYTEYK